MKIESDVLFVVGDVHGCASEFDRLLGQVNQLTARYGGLKRTHVISLGDLVNKGPDSSSVLQIWSQLKHKTLVEGNHENVTFRKGTTYDHELRVQELTDDERAILTSAVPFAWFEEPQAGGMTCFCLHGGLYPAYLQRHGQQLLQLTSQAATWDKKAKKAWYLTAMVRHIDPTTGNMVSLGKETPETPYWAEIYGTMQNGVPFHLLDETGTIVRVLHGHQPHRGTPTYGRTRADGTQDTMTLPLDWGCVFGNWLTGVLYTPDQEPRLLVERAQRQYVPWLVL